MKRALDKIQKKRENSGKDDLLTKIGTLWNRVDAKKGKGAAQPRKGYQHMLSVESLSQSPFE